MAKRILSSFSTSLAEASAEAEEEIYLFALINKSSLVDEAKASSPPSPAVGGLVK